MNFRDHLFTRCCFVETGLNESKKFLLFQQFYSSIKGATHTGPGSQGPGFSRGCWVPPTSTLSTQAFSPMALLTYRRCLKCRSLVFDAALPCCFKHSRELIFIRSHLSKDPKRWPSLSLSLSPALRPASSHPSPPLPSCPVHRTKIKVTWEELLPSL